MPSKSVDSSLTWPENPDGLLESQYGLVPYGLWCERESERINAKGGRKTVVRQRTKDGFVFVDWVDRKAVGAVDLNEAEEG